MKDFYYHLKDVDVNKQLHSLINTKHLSRLSAAAGINI